MFNKPLIGMNADYRGAQRNQPAFTAVAAGYYDAVQNAGGVPVIFPPLHSEDDMNVALDRVDGFMMVGGADLDPRNDGFMLHPTVKPMDGRRETFDRTLVRLVADRKMPFLGIGAGMQLLNVSRGGNLFLHIPEDLPNAIPHRDAQDPGHRHGLVVKPGSVMERVYGEGEIRVSSRHHMAIDELADGFTATATCPDGVIEAIESDDPEWIAIGTQFHPENDASSALDARIFEEFIEAIREPQPTQLRLVA
jgi:putative glutamine amidotransferase